MDMPKQMDAGQTHSRRQVQQGQPEETQERRKPASDTAETAAEQMQATHFSDWASI